MSTNTRFVIVRLTATDIPLFRTREHTWSSNLDDALTWRVLPKSTLDEIKRKASGVMEHAAWIETLEAAKAMVAQKYFKETAR